MAEFELSQFRCMLLVLSVQLLLLLRKDLLKCGFFLLQLFDDLLECAPIEKRGRKS